LVHGSKVHRSIEVEAKGLDPRKRNLQSPTNLQPSETSKGTIVDHRLLDRPPSTEVKSILRGSKVQFSITDLSLTVHHHRLESGNAWSTLDLRKGTILDHRLLVDRSFGWVEARRIYLTFIRDRVQLLIIDSSKTVVLVYALPKASKCTTCFDWLIGLRVQGMLLGVRRKSYDPIMSMSSLCLPLRIAPMSFAHDRQSSRSEGL